MSISGGPIGNNPSVQPGQLPTDAATPAQPSGQAEAGVGAKVQFQNPKDADIAALLTRAGVGGVQGADAVESSQQVKSAKAAQQAVSVQATLPPPMPPRVKMTQDLKTGAESFTNNLDAAITGSVQGGVNFDTMNANLMLAEFLKLNIMDPNNSVETHNELAEAMSTLRQKGIDDSLAKSAEAQEMKKEAEQYAQTAQIIGYIVS
ncbi:uncharacterized protein METZ01_LOCUS386425, partial [marine metagenome]